MAQGLVQYFTEQKRLMCGVNKQYSILFVFGIAHSWIIIIEL